MLDKLINENLTILGQGIEVLGHTPPSVYTADNAETFGSSCGAHFRHLIQHYQAFFSGVETGLIDYDHRDRTVDLESDRNAAVQALADLRDAFAARHLRDQPVQILQNYDPKKPRQPVASGISRELTFLVSHSIHHYALIGVILRLNGILVPQQFGFAPSTIFYLKGLAEEQATTTLVHAS
jgi:uncharacterized damage-inducible protein DinB